MSDAIPDPDSVIGRNADAYSLLFRIETALRRIVEEELSNEYGPGWPKHGLPGDVWLKCKSAISYERKFKWNSFVPHLAISRNDLEGAEGLLQRALESEPDTLTKYNMACVRAMRGDNAGALEMFRAVALANAPERSAGCVYRLKHGSEALEWEEVFEVKDLALLAKANIQRIELASLPLAIRN